MWKPEGIKPCSLVSAILLASCTGVWGDGRDSDPVPAGRAGGPVIEAPDKVQKPGKGPRGLAPATVNPVEDVRKSLDMVVAVLRKGDGRELFTQCYSPRFVAAMEQLDAMKRLLERFAKPDPAAFEGFVEWYEKARIGKITFNAAKDQATVQAPEGMDPLYLSRVNGRWYLDLTHGEYTPPVLMTLF